MRKPTKPPNRTPRRPRERPDSVAEKRRILQMMRQRCPQLFFDDRVRELQKTHNIDPARVDAILVSPYRPLRAWRRFEEVQIELGQIRDDLRHAVGASREALEEQVVRLTEEGAGLDAQVRAAHLGTGTKGSRPPSKRFWLNVPADISDDQWMNPYRWGWLHERAAALARYLSTTHLVPAKRPRSKTGSGVYTEGVQAVTAELVQRFYRFYFPRLTFTTREVKTALDHRIGRRAVST